MSTKIEIEELLLNVEKELNIMMPAFYKQFIKSNNLYESKLFNNLTLLYGLDDLCTRNNDYQIQQYMPGFLLMGDDSGGYGIVIRANNSADNNIYLVGFGSLGEDDVSIIAQSITIWVDKNYDTETVLFESKSITDFHNSDTYRLRVEHNQLNRTMHELEEKKSTGKIDLKAYLNTKKVLTELVEEFKQKNKDKKYQV